MMRQKTDFFRSDSGHFHGQWRAKGRVKDILYDARLAVDWSYLQASGRMKHLPARRILVVGVEIPARRQDLIEVIAKLSRTRHIVTGLSVPCGEGLGKFQNLNRGLRDIDLAAYDWVIVVDDDIAFGEGFLDRFIYLAEITDLRICMPAHMFRSNQTFRLTSRQWGSMVRLTNFVESGPLTAFRQPMFAQIFPFPELQWAWGTDIAWSEAARRLGLRIGVLDGTPIRHLRPVGGSYDIRLATDEAEAYLTGLEITRQREDILKTVKTISGIKLWESAEGPKALRVSQ